MIAIRNISSSLYSQSQTESDLNFYGMYSLRNIAYLAIGCEGWRVHRCWGIRLVIGGL